MLENRDNYDILDAEPRVIECYALHIASLLPVGYVGYATGPFTASSDKFEILIRGKGGHAMQPEDSVDSIQLGVQICNAIYQIRGRNVS